MGPIKLEPRSPKNLLGLEIDPNPDWTFDDMLSELNQLESRFSTVSLLSEERSWSREMSNVKRGMRGKKAFVMRVTEDEVSDWGGEDVKVRSGLSIVPAYQLDCLDICLSDDSEDELVLQVQGPVLEKTKVAEATCLELYEYELSVQEEIRNQILSLEAGLQIANDKLISSLIQVEKNAERRREMDRKLDMQYQRKIAEVLDSHLTAIQRDHEHRSQLEEKKIRDDSALEARRKEKVLQEEKLRQQKAKAEEEARLEAAKRADDARKAALEAESKALAETAENMAKENSAKIAASGIMVHENQKDSTLGIQTARSNVAASDTSGTKPTGSIVRASESALNLEEKRRHLYLELEAKAQSLMSRSNKDFVSYERRIGRVIRQICWSVENVRGKFKELIGILNDPVWPQSVGMLILAKKVISAYENPNTPDSTIFACGQVVVLVSSKVPQFMDVLVAEFHRVCIYTVPKDLIYSKSAFEVEDDYFKAIGYREEDIKIEEKKTTAAAAAQPLPTRKIWDTDSYLGRLESCMKLYGAVVQTQVDGVQNMHGLEEGWAWLARFGNALSANMNTAVALAAFLHMAGYSLHRKYKSQFRKLLSVINQNFLKELKTLKEDGDLKVKIKVMELQQYIETKKYLVEPEGSRLFQDPLVSHSATLEEEHHEQRYYSPNRYFY